MFRYAVTMIVLILLTACGSVPTTERPSDVIIEDKPDDVGLRLPPRESGVQNQKSASAVDQLLVQANIAIADDYLEKASALVERAIRLAPQDGRAYFSLAQIRYQQGQKNQAKSLAQKARVLTVNDTALLASIVQFQKKFAKRY